MRGEDGGDVEGPSPGADPGPRAVARRATRAWPALVGVVVALSGKAASAGPEEAQRGLALAQKGDCVAAIPLLEDAELTRPSAAILLAGCYAATGELIGASQVYHAIADGAPTRSWVRADHNAHKLAQERAAAIDARIPTLRFELPQGIDGVEVTVNGKLWRKPTEAQRVLPDAAQAIVARAKGRKDFTMRFVITEREHRIIPIKLELAGGSATPAADEDDDKEPGKEKPPPPAPAVKRPTSWLGARYRGVVIPRFVMNLFGEGGTNVVVPGGALTFTTAAGKTDVVVSLGYLNYRMSDTPYKPNGTPDTDYEIISSDLQALTATVDFMRNVPLDDRGDWVFRVGGGLGIGWMFAGDLYRTQAYPPTQGFVPGDPYTYQKCTGPNNPVGSFRYCNELERDKNLYGGYKEPSWFQGGARPLVYPWVVFPELGLTWHVSSSVALDLETGLSISGIMTGLGIRFGL